MDDWREQVNTRNVANMLIARDFEDVQPGKMIDPIIWNPTSLAEFVAHKAAHKAGTNPCTLVWKAGTNNCHMRCIVCGYIYELSGG
jgi:hypothetical protein